MKRLAVLSMMAGLVLCPRAGLAQESGGEKKSAAAGEEGSMQIWKWANFVVLAGGLGYLIGKNAGPFFAARSQKIRQDMLEAEEMRREAEARTAEVDRRLANLESAIAQLRAESQQEAATETERIRKQTAAGIAKIQAHAEQEIAAAGKAARAELKRYSAELALGLAEQKIRARMTPGTQDALVQGFVKDLDGPAPRAQTT